MKKVSVVITTHNRGLLLARAILSVINQTYDNIEIIVVDDGSKISAEKIVQQLSDEHKLEIKFARHPKSKGACAARNTGINMAKGHFIIGLDDDDEYEESRVEKLVSEYKDDLAFVASWTKVVRPDGTCHIHKTKKELTISDYLWKNPGTSFPLIAKNKIVEVGLFDEELEAAQDYDMWLRLMYKYKKCEVVQEPLYIIHTDAVNRIGFSPGKIRGRQRVIEKHSNLFSSKQLSYHKYYIRKLKKERIGIKEFFDAVPSHLWKIEYKYLLRSLLRVT